MRPQEGTRAQEGLIDQGLRMDIAQQAFSRLPEKVAGRVLRPMTAGSFAILLQRKSLLLFPDTVEQDELGEPKAEMAEFFGAVAEYVYLHTAELDEVVVADAEETRWYAAVKRLSLELSLEDAADFVECWGDAMAEIQAVQAAPVAGEEDEEEQEGKPGRTGLPPTLPPSGGTSPQSGSAGASGGSPTAEGSNTCTPSPAPTDPAASGSTPGAEMIAETQKREKFRELAAGWREHQGSGAGGELP